MAQLKDSIVSGNLRVTDTTLTDTLQVTTIKAPTSSGGTTYGPGTNGQVLKSNGTTTYWSSDSNTDEKVKSTKLAQSTAAATYYPTLMTGETTSGVNIFESMKFLHTPGTTSAVGNSRLVLGNATASGTANNEEGLIRLYSPGTAYHTIKGASISSNIDHTLPATGGTVLNTGTTSFTQTLTSGTKVGSIKINSTSTDIYAPTNTNTTYTLTQDSTDGHKITLTPSSGTAQTITIPDNNTTYSAGTGLSLSGTTFNHSNSITAVTTAVFKKITYDAQGHITGTSNVTASDLPSHTHDDYLGAVKIGNYYGMAWPDGTDKGSNSWIRTTRLGLIPYAANTDTTDGNVSSLGTSTWTFDRGYINNLYYKDLKTVTVVAGGTDDNGIDKMAGSYFFSGNNLFGGVFDWVGIQAGYSVDKWQIVGNASGGIMFRQNESGGTDTTSWSDFKALVIPDNITGSDGITVTNTTRTIGSDDTALTYDIGVNIAHSNSVTEETSFNKPFVKYDAHGHITESSYWSATAIGTGGEAGWVKVATMKHVKTYDNTPIMLTVSQRGNTITYRIHILFKNANNTDPLLDKFYLVSDENTNARAYIIKSATSTWDLYIRKIDDYEAIAITLTAGRYFDDHMEWTWTNVQTDESLITGGTEATKKVFYDSNISQTANTVLAAPNGSNGQATFRKLVAADIPDLDYVPNTQAGMNAAINLLSTGNATPALADYYVSQFASGGTTTTTYHRRPISALWNTFKGLITLSTTGTGNAVTAVSIANDGDNDRKITVTKGSTFSLSTHTHNYAGSSSAGGAATSANKLNTNAGDTYRPVYFTGGVPEECETPSSGSWFKGVPYVGSTGVMEIGKYIDFHGSNTSTADYDLRLEYDSTTTGHTITIPPTSATMSVNRKSLITDSSSDFASYAWHKFAEVTITSTNYDYFTTFVVSSGFITLNTYAAKKMGLLTMHVRTDSTRTFVAGEFEWLVAGEQIDPNNFVMVYTDTENTSCKVELWYKQLYRYEGFTFTILEEHTRTVKEIYTMKLYDASGHGSASHTSGTGTLVSKLSKLKNAPGIYAVKGTQTASTSVWTGEIDVSELYDGLTIAYYLPYASTSTSVTLNLTLSDGTKTGAIDCYYTNTSRITTHYGAGSTVILTYWSAGSISVSGTATTNNRWTRCDYNSNSSVTQNLASGSANRPLLMSYYQTGTTTTTAQVVYRNDSIYANPSTGTIHASTFVGNITDLAFHNAIYALGTTTDTATFNGTETLITSLPSSSGTSTPSYKRTTLHNFIKNVIGNLKEPVLYNNTTTPSQSATVNFNSDLGTPKYLKLFIVVCGSTGYTSGVTNIVDIDPSATDNGCFVSGGSPGQSGVSTFLTAVCIKHTVSSDNHTYTVIPGSSLGLQIDSTPAHITQSLWLTKIIAVY